MKAMAEFLKYVVGPMTAAPTVLFIMVNTAGLLFGFVYKGELCQNVRRNTTNRLERVLFVVGPYACTKDGGLLQPATKDLINWLTEVPK